MRLSLFTKLTALTTLLVLGASSVVAWFAIDARRDAAEASLRHQGRTVAQMVARSAEYGVYTEDADSLLAASESLDAAPEAAFVEVTDKRQRVLATHTFRGASSVPPRVAPLPVSLAGVAERYVEDPVAGSYIEFVAPVVSNPSADDPLAAGGGLGAVEPSDAPQPELLGYVRIGFATARIDAQTRAFLWSVIAFTAALLFGGLVVTVLIAYRITSPVRRMATLANAVSGGQLDLKVDIRGDNEMSDLAAAFNAMLARLHDYQDALKVANSSLEQKVRDRTQQLELAMQQARALAEQAQAANHAKSAFLATMSHELRTPLNAVIGLSQLFADEAFGEINAEQAECLDDILSSGQHLLALVEDVLDVAKIEAGGATIEPQSVSPTELVAESLVLVRDQASRRGVALTVSVDEAPPRAEVDPRAFKQVLANLVANAVKFTPDGGHVEVSVATATAGALAHRVPADFTAAVASLERLGGRSVMVVSVRDDGVGVDPDNLTRIFVAFQQEDASNARSHDGTGLGLTLSQQLVQLHHGAIWAYSAGRGHGSCFAFAVPLSQADDPRAANDDGECDQSVKIAG